MRTAKEYYRLRLSCGAAFRTVFPPLHLYSHTRTRARARAHTHTHTHIHTHTHVYTHARIIGSVLFACGVRLRARPSERFRRSLFSLVRSLMNSYLFLDRVPSELRGGARIRLLSSLERCSLAPELATFGDRFSYFHRVLFEALRSSWHYYFALIPY